MRCGDCAAVCEFNALALLGDGILVFPELCHGCGSCALICPEKAIREVPRVLGRLEKGKAGPILFLRGLLNVGEAMAVPVINALKESAREIPGQLVLLDAPPGVSCPMVETVRGADFVILVTEPTPAGLHDLELAHEAVRDLGIPHGVVINRDGIGDDQVSTFCRREGLPVLLTIPFHREIAEGIVRGQTLLSLRPSLGDRMRQMILEAGRLDGLSTVSAGQGWTDAEFGPGGVV
jgi:MinD superfamily P-loop ATPase